MPAALWLKRRAGELRSDHAAAPAAQFAADVKGTDVDAPRFALIAVQDAILTAAARLAHHPLRACDAVQLATALAVIDADPSMRSDSFDSTLNAAAAAEGLQILPGVA